MQERLETLRQKLFFQWGELAAHLGISRSMLDMVRKGRRQPGVHLLRRIEAAEVEAGLRPPVSVVVAEESLGGSASLRETSSSEVRKSPVSAAAGSSEVRETGRAEILRELAAIRSRIAEIERMLKHEGEP